MADSKILITANLNIPETTNNIVNELKQISADINAKNPLKILCSLDTSQAGKNIQSQLSTLSQKIKPLDLSINTGSVDKVVSNFQTSFAKTNDVLEKARKSFDSLYGSGTSTAKWIYDAQHNIEGFTVAVQKSGGEIEKFNYALKDTGNGSQFLYSGGSASNSGLKRQAEQALSSVTKLKSELLSVKAAYSDLNAAKPIQNQNSLDSLNQQYQKALSSIEALKIADSNAFSSMKANANSEIQVLKDMVKQFQNAEYVATSLRVKDFGTVKNEEIEKLKQFEAKIKGSNVEFSKMQAEIDSLNTRLRGAFSKEELTAYLNELSVVQAKFKALEQETKTLSTVNSNIANSLKSLNALSNINSFTKNSTSPKVVEIQSEIAKLISSYTELQTKLSGTKVDSSAFSDLKSKLTETDLQFGKVLTSARLLDAELKKENGADVLSGRIDKLKNNITAYMNANAKASAKMSPSQNISYGDWASQLVSQLNSGIDTATFNKINSQFRTMQSEVRALGYESNTTFTSMWNGIKKFSGFLGFASPMFLFVRKVRESVNELKSLDTILTEISKTSERTAESLEYLAENSFSTASEYGRKASDYLTGVQEMSRAGFSEKGSQNMAELSLLTQSAGNMTSELANAYLIATNSAYKFQGSAEKLTSVLDSQNYVTNHNALNMTELAEATKIAGSQAAQSGIAIDETTAAVGTMIASTQQGGEIAGRAFKAIIMNLQQVKADAEDIGDGGDAITTESLTKYEKACADLGVSLKEVKDGVTVLRDPMEILNELAAAFNQEADNSIKKANLINAIGGKYRGNQLSALLSNWDNYQKMLAEFNSENAVGSAMRESLKTAESWEGRLNSLSNKWNEFVNNFINSKIAKSGISSATKIIDILDKIVNKTGSLKTLIISIAAIKGFKNAGIFTTIDSSLTKSGKSLAVFNKEWNTLVNDVRNTSGIKNKFTAITESANKLSIAQKAAAVSTRLLSSALNIAANVGIAIVINGIVSAIYKLVNAEKEAAEKSEELRQTAINNAQSLSDESEQIDDLVKKYSEYVTTTTDLADVRDEIIDTQSQLADIFGDEKTEIDLLNKSYAENIRLINEKKKAESDAFLRDNRQAYDEAKKFLESEAYAQTIYNSDDTYFTKISDDAIKLKALGGGTWSEQTKNNWQQIADSLGYNNFILDSGSNVAYIGGTPEQKMRTLERFYESYKKQIEGLTDEKYKKRLNEIGEILSDVTKKYEDAAAIVENYDAQEKFSNDANFWNDETKNKQFESLTQKVIDLNNAFRETNSTAAKLTLIEDIDDVSAKLYDLAGNNALAKDTIDSLFEDFDSDIKQYVNSITSSADSYKSTFADYSENGFKSATENIEKFKSALQSLNDNGYVSAETMWELISLDESLADSFSRTADGYRISSDKIIESKDELIRKELEYAENEQNTSNQIINNLKLRLQAIQKEKAAEINSFYANSPADVKAHQQKLQEYDNQIKQIGDSISEVVSTSDKWKLAINQIKSGLGDTVSLADKLERQSKEIESNISKIQSRIDSLNDEISELEDKQDELLRYQEYQVDKIVDNLEDEQTILENEKSALEEQLEILQIQKSELEEQIEIYENIVSIVEDAVNDEKSAIEKEKSLVESEKDELQKQLDILEDKKSAIEDSIQDYEKIYSLVSDIVSKETESIESERDAVESYYDEMISKLQEENNERERAIDLAEKEAALENAKKNKIRVYNEQTGWTWADNTEAIQKAQNDLDNAKNQIEIERLEKEKDQKLKEFDEKINAVKAYGEKFSEGQQNYENNQTYALAEKLLGMSREEIYKKIAEQDTDFVTQLNETYEKIQESRDGDINSEIDYINQQIEEKDRQIEVYEEMIEEWDRYIEKWQDTVKEYKKTQNDLIAKQKMSSEWLEKVKKKDISILNDFKNNYSSYQDALNGSINQEIVDLENSIKAKDNEIESKKRQIEEWNSYKDELNQYVNDVSQTWSDYVTGLGTIAYNENSNYIDRCTNLTNFKNEYLKLTGEIIDKKAELENATNELEVSQARLSDIQTRLETANNSYNDAVYNLIWRKVDEYNREAENWQSYADMANSGDPVAAAKANEYASRLRGIEEILRQLCDAVGIDIDSIIQRVGYATGGVNTSTGFAWLDGTPDKPELVLNNVDTTKLYNLLHSLSADQLKQKFHLDTLSEPPKSFNTVANNTSSVNNNKNSQNIILNFYGNIETNDPVDFMQKMNRYIQHNKLNGKINY